GDSSSGMSADLGGLWTPVPALRLGLAYDNVGSSVSGFFPASSVRLGGSFRIDLAPANHVLLAASTAIEPQGVDRLQMGAEAVIQNLVAVRNGYQASLADN